MVVMVIGGEEGGGGGSKYARPRVRQGPLCRWGARELIEGREVFDWRNANERARRRRRYGAILDRNPTIRLRPYICKTPEKTLARPPLLFDPRGHVAQAC